MFFWNSLAFSMIQWMLAIHALSLSSSYLHCSLAIQQLPWQLMKNPPTMQETLFDSWFRKIHWRRDRLPIPAFLGFPCSSAGKESACDARDLGSILGSGRFPGEGKATHSNILAWKISWGHKESDTTERPSLSLSNRYPVILVNSGIVFNFCFC